MEKKITLFHGSEKVIEHPVFGAGKSIMISGLAFTARRTRHWQRNGPFPLCGTVCKPLYSGYRISAGFTFEQPGLYHSQLDRRAGRASSFSIKTPVARRAKQYLIDNFSVNVNAYDLITGYRADDSYFDYAESFLNNAISVEQLSQAMRLGKLGSRW